ncbi:MAG: acetyl-CoA carboxylase, biotin carboxyl carrier protein, partial [Deltaproteobacteria bacterium]
MDLDRIEALLKLLGEHDVSEFRYEDENHSLRLRLGAVPMVSAVAAAP